jgi:hypothetical protein
VELELELFGIVLIYFLELELEFFIKVENRPKLLQTFGTHLVEGTIQDAWMMYGQEKHLFHCVFIPPKI